MKKVFLLALTILSAFSVDAQKKEQINFSAKITNRNSDTLVIRGANNFIQVIPINKKEVFAAIFEAPKGFYQLSDGTKVSSLYLKPNSQVNLTVNAKEFDETIVYKGKGIDESIFLAEYTLTTKKFLKEAFSINEAEFTTLLQEKNKSDIESLAKGNLDPEFQTALKNSFEQFNQYAVKKYESSAKANKFKGKASPDFDYENYKGGKTKLSDLKGKYVYIDIWATWCGPCLGEIPYLQKIEEKYHGKNIEFVSISIDNAKDIEKWKKFVANKNLGGIQLFADNDWRSDFVSSYGVTGIPRFILIDPKGNILESDAARPSSPELQIQLDTLLK